MELTLYGAHRFALAERARVACVAQLGQEGYLRHLTSCLAGPRDQVIASARERATQVTRDTDTWLTALCILYELHALPEPLTITLAPGVTHLPITELPQGVLYGR